MTNYRISTDSRDMDFDAIHGFISRSYWAAEIPEDTMRRGIEHSLNFCVLTDVDELVGFARVITDQATFAYLCDVFVLEAHRGQGLSKQLMRAIKEDTRLQGLRRFMLATADAHTLYEQFGFTAPAKPENLMEICLPGIYQNTQV